MTLSNQLKSSTDEHGTDPEVESFTGKSAGHRRSRSGCIAWAAIVFLWPFFYFYRFLIPDRAFSLTVGNDFIWLYYKYKVYLLDLLAGGHFPLWSPSEAAGFPFFSSPYAQAVYPLNLALLAFYHWAGGYSVFDHQAFTVLGISIYGLGLYLWLSKLVSNRRAVVFSVLLVSVSFKLAELMRFPNAVHAAAWMPWLLYGATLAMHAEKRRAAAVILFISGVMILTAGYPYYVYYCLFLFLPYVFFIFFGRTREIITLKRPAPTLDRKNYLVWIAAPLAAALLVCSPYLYKMRGLLSETTDRAGMDYHYSTSYPFHFSNTIGALIFPPASQTEGWYYFSVLGLLLIILFIVVSLKDDKGPGLKRRFVALTIIWWGVISYISYGADSYLFDFLWRFLPGFSQLRAWGRVNIVLLPLIALLLARSYDHFEELLGLSEEVDKGRGKTGWALAIIAISAAIVLAGQWWLYVHKSFNFYWLYFFSNFHGWEAVFIFATIASFILLAGLLVLSIWWPLASSKSLAAVVVLCVAIAAIDMRQVGSEQWSYPASHDQAVRRRLGISNALIRALSTPRDNMRETISLDQSFHAGYIWNWYFERYTAFHGRVFSLDGPNRIVDPEEAPWMGRLLGLYDGTRLFVSTRIDHSSVREFFEDSDKTVYDVQPQVIVEAYDGDRLVLDVSTRGPMFLNFIDNWDADWVARINGRPAEIEKLFGTFKSVRLEAGKSKVEFLYCPFSRKKP